MKVYIRIKHTGEFFNQNCYDAYTGCEELGIPVVPYKVAYSLEGNAPEDLVVGTLDDMEIALDRFDVHPDPLDYPEELYPFLGRKVWQSTLYTITSHEDCWHVFVKPVNDVKRFSGTVLDECKDLIRLGADWKISPSGAVKRSILYPSGASGCFGEKSSALPPMRGGGTYFPTRTYLKLLPGHTAIRRRRMRWILASPTRGRRFSWKPATDLRFGVLGLTRSNTFVSLPPAGRN